MKKLILLLLLPLAASAQTAVQKNTSGVVSNGPVQFGSGNTLSAVAGATVNFTGATLVGFNAVAVAGGSPGQVQFNNAGSLGGFTVSGDGTLNTSTGALTVSKIGNKAVTLGGALTTVGAYTTTITTTGNSSVTLPTSGTLATVAGTIAAPAFPPTNNLLFYDGAEWASLQLGTNLSISGTTLNAAGGGGGGSGTVTSVAMTVPSFLSISGSPVTTSGTFAVTLSGTALPVLNGGTGQTTANAAFNALAPTQSAQSGKLLTTDGTNTSWVTAPIASGGTGQVTANAAFNALAPSQTGQGGKILTTNGTNTSWTSAGAGGSPAGSNTYVQYNSLGSFGANAGFTSDTSGNVGVNSLTAAATSSFHDINPDTTATRSLGTASGPLYWLDIKSLGFTSTSAAGSVGLTRNVTGVGADKSYNLQRSGVLKKSLGLDASDNLGIFNSSGSEIASVTDAGLFQFLSGIDQTFNPSSTASGINVGQIAGDPSGLTNGDVWYNSSTPALNARINGATVSLGAHPTAANPTAVVGATAVNGSATTFMRSDAAPALGITSTRGAMLKYGASGWTGLNPGTTGYVLTSNGTGADPSYQPASGSSNVVYTSSTCVSDADLSIGSTTFGTDQTTKLQTILNLASTGTPLLVYWDGAYSCTGNLTIYSNTTIIALAGCGAILRTSSNAYMFVNAHVSGTTITDQYITIDGGIWNGNGDNQTQPPTAFYTAFKFWGVNYLNLNNMTVYTCCAFAWHLANVFYVNCLNDFVNSGTNLVTAFRDGIHINGPAQWITIKNFRTACNDDQIAINADDTMFVPSLPYGPISHVLIDGVSILGDLHSQVQYGIKMLSGADLIDDVVVHNVSGKTRCHIFPINSNGGGSLNNPGGGYYGDITLTDIDVLMLAPASGGGSDDAGINTNPATAFSTLQIRNYKWNSQTRPMPALIVQNLNHGDLDLVCLDGAANTTPVIRFDGIINRFNLTADIRRSALETGPAIRIATAFVSLFVSNSQFGNSQYAIGYDANAGAPQYLNMINVAFGPGTSILNIGSSTEVWYLGLANNYTTALKSGSGTLTALAGSEFWGDTMVMSKSTSPKAHTGTVTLTSGAGTVTNANFTANSTVTFTPTTVSGSITQQPFIDTINPGTGFTVAAGVGDNSTYTYTMTQVQP